MTFKAHASPLASPPASPMAASVDRPVRQLRVGPLGLLVMGALAGLGGCTTTTEPGLVTEPAPQVQRQGEVPEESRAFAKRLEALGAESITLTGQTRTELGTLLGEPALSRTEGPAEILQYRSPRCVLLVVLYGAGEGQAVRFADAQPRTTLDGRVTARANDLQECIASVRADRAVS